MNEQQQREARERLEASERLGIFTRDRDLLETCHSLRRALDALDRVRALHVKHDCDEEAYNVPTFALREALDGPAAP